MNRTPKVNSPVLNMKHVECSRCTNCVKCSENARVTTPCFQYRMAPRAMCHECIYS